MTPMSDGDKAILREQAFEVAEIVGQRIAKEYIAHLEKHALTCATTRKVERWENRFKGLLIGVGLCGLFTGFSAAAALFRILSII